MLTTEDLAGYTKVTEDGTSKLLVDVRLTFKSIEEGPVKREELLAIAKSLLK